jgi:hypothetical protein
MKLLTAEIIKNLEKNPLYSGESKTVAPVLVKFFNPCGSGTWYVLEAEKDTDDQGNEDWLFFGLADLHEKELGYFRLSELKSVRLRFNLKIERDMHFDGYVLDKESNTVRKAVQS